MANIKVSEMTQADSVNDIDLLMIVQGSTNKKVTKQTLMKNINTEITNIKSEQVTQNTKIQANTTAIETKASQSDLDAVETDIQTNRASITALQTENNNLRKALPNIKGTGTDITLNNTSENKFNELVVKGNTEQDSYTGKNLLDGANPTSTNAATVTMTANTIKVSSTATNTTPYVRYEFNNVTEGDIYKLNAIIKNSNGRIVLQRNNNGWTSAIVIDYNNGTSISSLTYEIPEGVTDIRVLLYADKTIPSGASESSYENVIVTKNNTDMTYEPYVGGMPSPNPDFPQQIKNVTGNVNVKIQNKNLLNLNQCTFNRCTLNNDGSVTCNVNNYYFPMIQTTSLNNYLLAHKGQNITFSIDKIITGKQISIVINGTLNGIANKTQEQTASDSKSVTLNIANDFEKINYVQLRFNRSSTPFTDTTTVISEIMLEFGSTATQYTGHQEQNLPFTLRTQRMYQGSYLADDGIHYPTYTQTTLGNVSALQSATLFGTPCKYAVFPLPNAKQVTRSYGFKSNKISPANETYGKYTAYRNSRDLYVLTSTDDTVSNFNSKISGSIVEYELTEEEIAPYNATQQAQWNAIKEAMSYYKQTNISSTSNEISAIIEANAVGDLNLILS